MATPTAEIQIDEALIGRLVTAQLPQLANQAVRIVAHGWDNVVARIGEAWMTRLPRRALAAPLVLHEQRWLPVLAPRLPLPIPVPVHAGTPTEEFPWPWSVGRWLPGRSAAEERPSDLRLAASRLAEFVRALHQPAPPAPPRQCAAGRLFRAHVDVDGPAWRRAAGWALHFSLVYLTSDATTPMPTIGRVSLAALLDEMP